MLNSQEVSLLKEYSRYLEGQRLHNKKNPDSWLKDRYKYSDTEVVQEGIATRFYMDHKEDLAEAIVKVAFLYATAIRLIKIESDEAHKVIDELEENFGLSALEVFIGHAVNIPYLGRQFKEHRLEIN